MMMQAAHFGDLHDLSGFGRLDGSGLRAVSTIPSIEGHAGWSRCHGTLALPERKCPPYGATWVFGRDRMFLVSYEVLSPHQSIVTSA